MDTDNQNLPLCFDSAEVYLEFIQEEIRTAIKIVEDIRFEIRFKQNTYDPELDIEEFIKNQKLRIARLTALLEEEKQRLGIQDFSYNGE